ncbi:MAG: phytanoyl-CoA dioxygenase family protein [Planctomycetota bacterium]|nr:phytanoyl-CoA dioxygenase family protein [Planctomycetota bacterium]
MLTAEQIEQFHRDGHLTVDEFFTTDQIQVVLKDLDIWAAEVRTHLSREEESWFLEQNAGDRAPLRKLDDPVYHRPAFQHLAQTPRVRQIIEQLIGPDVSIFFSQVFMKPAHHGGPKPIHQDNFYFDPEDHLRQVTLWIALDEATTENGCLFFANGSHHEGVVDHIAPADEPFNLQVPGSIAEQYTMTAAPVAQGGISIHHGSVFHQSSANQSDSPRRAVAMHFVPQSMPLIKPTLTYDNTRRFHL